MRDGPVSARAREVDMFRRQLHAQVRVGQWRDFYGKFEKLDKLARAKNLVPTQLWTVTFGPLNGAILITDYETLEAFDRDTKAFTNDPDLMNLWRDMGKHVDGI